MKFLRSVVVAGVILFAGVYFGSNYAVSQVFERWLGVPVKVGSVRWGFSSHRLIIKNMFLLNPEGYNGKNLARISRIQADYDASDFRHGLFKIKRLELTVDQVWLEKKALSESNLMELKPLHTAVSLLSQSIQEKTSPVRFSIETVRLQMDKVTFQTQLGNDLITENRKVDSSAEDLSGLNTPDSVAVYAALLALKSAGWQTLLPTRAQVETQLKTQVNDWVEQAKQQALILQAQINQFINEKLNQPA